MDIIGNNGLDQVVGDDAVAGGLNLCTMRLFKAPFTVDRNTLLADLTAIEADYTGYAAEAIVWSAPTISDDGQIEYQGVTGEFRPTGTAITNSIYGGFIVAGGALMWAWEFPNGPLPMGSALDNIVVTPRFRARTTSIAEVIS